MNGNGKKPKFIHQIYDDKVCVEQVSKEWLLFTLCFSKVLFLSAALNKLEVWWYQKCFLYDYQYSNSELNTQLCTTAEKWKFL